MSLLDVTNLSVKIEGTNVSLVEDINFSLRENSCLGIVGESGSGKTMTCKGILRLTSPKLIVSGQALYQGQDILKMKKEPLRKLRGHHICMVLQDAMSAFDPLFTIGHQMAETLIQNKGVSKTIAYQQSRIALETMKIRLPEDVLLKYPHQLSGGMLQRCMIALAVTMEPDIIIADEPTTALDSINQYEVIRQLERLKEQFGTSLIFISHDLGIVKRLANDVLVMKEGGCVESGSVKDIFRNPQHPYTQYLIQTRLDISQRFRAIKECAQ